MQHTISVLVENKFGVLARIAGLFSGRGFNIESLCVAETQDPSVSRMTVVTRGDDPIIEQITKQLNKLVDIIKVSDLTGKEFVDREMALIKVHVSNENRSEILGIVDIFRCKVVDASPRSYVLEVTGDQPKIEAIINILKPLGIKEVVRTGKVAIARGQKGILEAGGN
jgi:acetolactate synthase-1/3 small subunit